MFIVWNRPIIDPPFLVSRPRTVQTGLYKRSLNCYQRHSRHGTTMIQASRQRRACDNPQKDRNGDSKDGIIEFSEASFVFQQISPQSKRVSVMFQRSLTYAGSFLTKPILSVSALLPSDSKVFRLIEAGDLEGLMKSLSLREVRLTDRDDRGRCLLNVSTLPTIEGHSITLFNLSSMLYTSADQMYANFFLTMVRIF